MIFTTANSGKTEKELRRDEIKRAKQFHKNSNNAQFVNSPANQLRDVKKLLNQELPLTNRGNVKVGNLLFNGNVKFKQL